MKRLEIIAEALSEFSEPPLKEDVRKVMADRIMTRLNQKGYVIKSLLPANRLNPLPEEYQIDN